MDLDFLLSSILEEKLEDYTEEFRNDCRIKVKTWLRSFMTRANSIEKLTEEIDRL